MAFRGDSTDTYTYVSGSTGGTVDLGARNTYRYINASNVYNKGKSDGQTTHTGTYTFPSNDTGGTKDLGVNHSYRYVNAQNVYNKGVADASQVIAYLHWDSNGVRLFDFSIDNKYAYTYGYRTDIVLSWVRVAQTYDGTMHISFTPTITVYATYIESNANTDSHNLNITLPHYCTNTINRRILITANTTKVFDSPYSAGIYDRAIVFYNK